jgi:hypothetical protein
MAGIAFLYYASIIWNGGWLITHNTQLAKAALN